MNGSSMRRRALMPWITLVMLSWAPDVRAQSTSVPSSTQQPQQPDDLSAKATDPTAALMSFGFINDFRTSFHELDDTGYEFRFQPVVPFRAFGASNILRVIVPFQGSGPGTTGLKDISIFDVVVVPQPWGRLAIGPVMSLYESDGTAESKFAIGPAVGAVVPASKRLLVGAFNQNLFAAHVAISQLQPVITYQLGRGWDLSAGDLQFAYDWESDQWANVPLGFQIGVVRSVATQPFRFYLNPQWNVKDVAGVVKSKVILGVTLLAPGA